MGICGICDEDLTSDERASVQGDEEVLAMCGGCAPWMDVARSEGLPFSIEHARAARELTRVFRESGGNLDGFDPIAVYRSVVEKGGR
jgi:hypothetical protein